MELGLEQCFVSNKMIVFIIEYNYINPDTNSLNSIINNTIQEYNTTYGEGYTKMDWKNHIKFF